MKRLVLSPLSLSAGMIGRGSWMADNGNGTCTNPLLYDESSDPDLIRDGEDFYLAGTTMHSMPGLVVLHSRDLVNWTFLSHAFDRLELGSGFDLEDGNDAYGQGIWAPCIRCHEGNCYLFSNVNGHGLQVFVASDPAGPWEHRRFKGAIHDLSVLFDDDGRGFLTVVGAGLSADIRPMKTESGASLFLWQDMLRDHQCMLLSLKTNRYVGIDSSTGEPYGADWPGADPNRREGSVLTWRENESQSTINCSPNQSHSRPARPPAHSSISTVYRTTSP